MTEINDGIDSGTDAADLSLAELRDLRHRLQHDDDLVSYARRVAQARLDLVRATQARRATDAGSDISGEVERVLSHHLTGGPARPPRPTEDLSDNALADELDHVCAEHHFGRLDELDDGELDALAAAISDFEGRVSADRQHRFERLDALSAELVRRYRDGEASVDSLLDD